MTQRRDRRRIAEWEEQTRRWAHDAARDLVLDIHQSAATGARPYDVGVRLHPAEVPWIEFPGQLVNERMLGLAPEAIPVRRWLATNQRVVGRLGDGLLRSWEWLQFIGCRVDLGEGRESVAFDMPGEGCVVWEGPGLAPLAVVGIQRLYGSAALLDHPGIDRLRTARLKRRCP